MLNLDTRPDVQISIQNDPKMILQDNKNLSYKDLYLSLSSHFATTQATAANHVNKIQPLVIHLKSLKEKFTDYSTIQILLYHLWLQTLI